MNLLYMGIEAGAVCLFLVAGWLALRRGLLPFLELASAAGFGVLLEQGSQMIFETYEYSSEFVLAIDRAPLAIGLAWALIIAGAMRITDALGVRRRYAPFADSTLAIMLDLAFDAVAIRMGLWTWRDIGPTDGWFGVPAGNFYTWLFITLAFSLVTRLLRDAAGHRPTLAWWQLAAPIPAYGVLLAGIMSFSLLKPITDPAPGGGLSLFAISLAVFAALSAWGVWGPDRARPGGESLAIIDLRLAFATRVAIHLFFLAALIVMGLASTEPMLLAVALALLMAEVPLAALAHRRQALPSTT